MIKLFFKLCCNIYIFIIEITVKLVFFVFSALCDFIIALFQAIKEFIIRKRKNDKFTTTINSKQQFLNIKQEKKESTKYLNEEYLRIYHDIEFDFEKEAQYYNNHCCPNCGIVFEKEIKTTRDCPECKKKIIKRNNYLTKQNFLMTEDKFKLFEEYGKDLQDLNFYEEILKHVSYNCSNLKEKILEKSNRNIGDLVWGLCNDLSLEYSVKGVSIINKCKTKSMQDKIFDVSEAKRLFGISNIYTLNMAKIAEHEDKIDISMDILCNYLHNEVNAYMLEFIFCDLYEFKEQRLIQSLNTCYLKEFLQNHSISIDQFEKYYKNCNRNFVIPIIDKNKAWNYIEKNLKIN